MKVFLRWVSRRWFRRAQARAEVEFLLAEDDGGRDRWRAEIDRNRKIIAWLEGA